MSTDPFRHGLHRSADPERHQEMLDMMRQPATPPPAAPPVPGQPRPVLEAAHHEAKSLLSGDAAATGTVIAVLSYFGLSSATSNFVLALLGLIPGAVAYGATLFAQAQAAYRVWQNAEGKVTPTSAPRAADGTPLVPETAATTVQFPPTYHRGAQS